MTVNGRSWPVHRVEARQYRLLVVNACSARFLTLVFSTSADNDTQDATSLPFYLTGARPGLMARGCLLL